jgi:hypothetical protein
VAFFVLQLLEPVSLFWFLLSVLKEFLVAEVPQLTVVARHGVYRGIHVTEGAEACRAQI